jgi:hypothetical protein
MIFATAGDSIATITGFPDLACPGCGARDQR